MKVYETMKPRDAASIFNDMDMPVLLQVVDRMKDTKVSPVLAAMQPDRARLVTTQLAAKRTRTITIPDSRTPDPVAPDRVTPDRVTPDRGAQNGAGSS